MPDDAAGAVRTVVRLARMLECSLESISLPQYRVLAAVDGGGERTTHLACDLAVAKPTITAAVDVLAARGYLKREPVLHDRRSIRIVLTPAGKRALQEAEATMAAALRQLVSETGETASLLTAITALAPALGDSQELRRR